MTFTKEHLNKLIQELVLLGEDEESLLIWVDMFDAMEESEQQALFKNLEEEKKMLSELASVPE